MTTEKGAMRFAVDRWHSGLIALLVMIGLMGLAVPRASSQAVWKDLGFGLAGTHGIPLLVGSGPLTPGSDMNLHLSSAVGMAKCWVVTGASQLGLPFKGGVMVPNPDYVYSISTIFGFVDTGGPWSAGVPSGTTLYFQMWIQDPAGPSGFAATNAVSGTTP